MKTVFSGIQPSGELHLGNYLGAIRNWTTLQESYRCFFSVVDYHAITQTYEPSAMSARVFDMVTDLLACGVDPERSVLFLQSMVPEHVELCWIFNTVSMFGDVSRMTQFKDKSEHQPENINVALFDYPVLQAADILLYKAQAVPVGVDQVQHIELTRRVARAFNNRWGDTFPEPEALLSETPKLLGLDGVNKMSKSLGNSISLNESPDGIRKLLKTAATDPARVMRTDPGDPDKCNVYTLHKFFSTEEQKAWVRQGCTTAGIGCVDCKKVLAENVVAHLAPIRERKAELQANPQKVRDILVEGARRAREVAATTMDEVRERLGLWRP